MLVPNTIFLLVAVLGVGDTTSRGNLILGHYFNEKACVSAKIYHEPNTFESLNCVPVPAERYYTKHEIEDMRAGRSQDPAH